MFRTRRKQPTEPQWNRHKMLALLVGAAAVGVLVLLGLGLAVTYALTSDPRHPPESGPATSVPPTVALSGAPSHPQASTPAGDTRDAIANRPMRNVDDVAARPGPVAPNPPKATLLVPRPTRTGPGGVLTGFPRTPAGALAQLAAIDQTLWSSASYDTAVQIVGAWVLPGGPTAQTWTTIRGLGQLVTAGSGDQPSQPSFVLTPLMGQIKGALPNEVAPDFVVPCIDFQLDVTIQRSARSAVADCQRMQWTDGRWQIAPGPEPAEAPAVWPGTDLSFQVGYRFLKESSHG